MRPCCDVQSLSTKLHNIFPKMVLSHLIGRVPCGKRKAFQQNTCLHQIAMSVFGKLLKKCFLSCVLSRVFEEVKIVNVFGGGYI
jgi:hypothetical protein